MEDVEPQMPVGWAPIRQELARRMVLGIVGFWLLGPPAVLLAEGGPAGLVITLVGVGSFLVFAYAFAKSATEGTRLRPLDLWNPQVPSAQRYEIGQRMLKPSWWRSVVDATGWPSPSVWTGLGLSLAFCMFTLVFTFSRLFT